MTITATYTNAEKTFVNALLEPGDHLASENVQAEHDIPGYVIPGYIVDGHEVSGVLVPPTKIPAGAPKPICIPCNEDNPVWLALKALVDEGTVTIGDYVEPPPPFINDISARQFYQQAAIAQLIDEDEMLDAFGGKIPPVLLNKINTFPGPQRLEAKALLAGAQTFKFDSPYTLMIGALMEPPMDEDAMRAFWAAAAKLV